MRWPQYQHIFFDCDSTLSAVEGIDALAAAIGKEWRVSVLTNAAMQGEVDLEDVYGKRLKAVKPTRGQVLEIKQIYKQKMVQDAADVIKMLQILGHQVYIISGGLAEPVVEFGLYLGVPKENIRAVGVEYDRLSGQWWQQIGDGPNISEQYLSHDDEPLTVSDGKAKIIGQFLQGKPGRSLLVGDGISDLLAGKAVDLFVGFGGVIIREPVRQKAPVYILAESMAPLLAIASGPVHLSERFFPPRFHEVITRAITQISNGAIEFNSDRLKAKFSEAWKASH